MPLSNVNIYDTNVLVQLVPNLKVYRAAWQAAGHPGNGKVYLRVPVYIAATEKAFTSDPAFSSTKLWPIASLGSVPALVRTILISSPTLASIAVTLNFIASLAVISITRGAATANAAAEMNRAAEETREESFMTRPPCEVGKRMQIRRC